MVDHTVKKKKKKARSDSTFSFPRLEFSIYGDLDNERTEIDTELVFGFLKMGVTSVY